MLNLILGGAGGLVVGILLSIFLPKLWQKWHDKAAAELKKVGPVP